MSIIDCLAIILSINKINLLNENECAILFLNFFHGQLLTICLCVAYEWKISRNIFDSVSSFLLHTQHLLSSHCFLYYTRLLLLHRIYQQFTTHGWDDEATRERASTTWLIRDDGAFPPQYNKSGMPVVHWFVLVIHLCVGYSQKSNGLSSYKNSHLLFIGLRQSFLFFKGPIINKEKESRSHMQNQLTSISPDRGFCDGIWRSHLFTIETHIG